MKDIDEEDLVRAYVEERLSVRAIAKRQKNISHTTVARILRKRLGNLRAWRLPGEN